MSLYVVGQINGKFGSLKDKISQSNIKDSDIIICGNFGIIDEKILSSPDLIELNYYCIQNKNHLYLLRGNDDNPGFYDGRKVLSNIETLKDFSVKTFKGINILFIGGGISRDRIDKYYQGKYFEDEKINFDFKSLDSYENIEIIISFKPEPYIFDNFITNFISYWVSGDACLENQLGKERDEMKRFFKKIKRNNNIKYIISSHINKSIEVKVKDIIHKSLASLEFFEII